MGVSIKSNWGQLSKKEQEQLQKIYTVQLVRGSHQAFKPKTINSAKVQYSLHNLKNN